MDRFELGRAIGAAHDLMAQVIAGISDEQLLQPAMQDWTGKDLLAHMAWWHDHSVAVIEELTSDGQAQDEPDPADTTDAINERSRREHADDPPDLTRRAFDQSFRRLVAALERLSDEELFAADHWPALLGEPLVETILWDSSRHYDAHREHLESLMS